MESTARMDKLTSEELAVSTKTGSEEHFSELVRRHRDSLYQMLRRRVPNREDAEDLTQETFMRAHQKIELFDPRYKFETWLFVMGARLAYSAFRKKKIDQVEIQETDSITDENPAGIISITEQCSNTWDVAKRILTPAQTEVMWHRYADDMSIKEISHKTGKTAVYVKVLLHRGRAAMVKHFNRKEQQS